MACDIEAYFSNGRKRTPALHREFAKAKGAVVEMMHVPTGFMLIDVEKVLVKALAGAQDYGSMGKQLKTYFPVRVFNGVLESEDWGFCSICRENGIPVYLHTDVVLPHTGTVAYDWNKFG